MKITKSQLKQIIKEEILSIIKERDVKDPIAGMTPSQLGPAGAERGLGVRSTVRDTSISPGRNPQIRREKEDKEKLDPKSILDIAGKIPQETVADVLSDPAVRKDLLKILKSLPNNPGGAPANEGKIAGKNPYDWLKSAAAAAVVSNAVRWSAHKLADIPSIAAAIADQGPVEIYAAGIPAGVGTAAITGALIMALIAAVATD